jgi:hypothetical protein
MAFKSTKYQRSKQADEPMDPIAETQEQLNALLEAYYQQLTPFEQRTCHIARDHLGSSFDLARSNGFLRWSSTRKT